MNNTVRSQKNRIDSQTETFVISSALLSLIDTKTANQGVSKMEHKYEMRIEAKDKKKIIRYIGDDDHMHWSDTYNSAGAVIEDEPDQLDENGITVGEIKVPHMEWSEVVRIMIEDAGLMSGKAEAGLTEEAEVSVVE